MLFWYEIHDWQVFDFFYVKFYSESYYNFYIIKIIVVYIKYNDLHKNDRL